MDDDSRWDEALEVVTKIADVPQVLREYLDSLKDRIARRYQGSSRDRDVGYGMEIVYVDLIDILKAEGGSKTATLPPGYTAEELERDSPYNQWLHE